MLSVERRKQSGLVGEPETQGERPWSCAGMLSVLERQLSELAELPSVFVSTHTVFGQRRSAWGRMLHSFRQMPGSFGSPPLSAPTAAPGALRDALEEAWAALTEEGDALRDHRDAFLEPRDALAIRGDAVRRRGRDLRGMSDFLCNLHFGQEAGKRSSKRMAKWARAGNVVAFPKRKAGA